LKTVQCLLMILVFGLISVSPAVAVDEYKNLVEWTGIPTSSDPPGTLDFMDPGNPNSADCRDIGTTTCAVNGAGDLVCTMSGTYPGYQAHINATITNITKQAVTITAVRFEDKPEALLVETGHLAGENLVGKVLPKNTSLDIRIVTRMGDIAQDSSYQFKIIIEARQKIEESGGGDNPYDDYTGGDSGEPETVVKREEPRVAAPPGETSRKMLEPIKLPIELPLELPKTGADMLVFLGSGLALGGIGFLLRRTR
jgi:LPXTG-motif cell wall-anchored protein